MIKLKSLLDERPFEITGMVNTDLHVVSEKHVDRWINHSQIVSKYGFDWNNSHKWRFDSHDNTCGYSMETSKDELDAIEKHLRGKYNIKGNIKFHKYHASLSENNTTKLQTLMCEGLKLNPLTTFQQLRQAKTITCFHASESSNFEPYDYPLHVGSIQQSMDIIRHMSTQVGVNKKFYVYQLEVSLGDLANFVFDEDPIESGDVDPNLAKHNSYAYINRIEHSQGLRQGSNLSVVIMNPKEQIISQHLVHVSK